MGGFPFVHRQNVRFRDVDAMGHVNNAVFLTYVEEARFAFMRELGLVESLEDLTMVVARAEVDFRSPVRFAEEVEVGVRASRFGTKSFELDYELRAGGRVVAQAKTVIVAYDYERHAPMPLPDAWRAGLAA